MNKKTERLDIPLYPDHNIEGNPLWKLALAIAVVAALYLWFVGR